MKAPPNARLQVGGTLGLADLYIERAEDDAVYELLARGEYVNVMTSRQMGKSSLMIRLIDRLTRERSARIVTIDMAGDLGTPADADRWYVGFLDKVALDLELEIEGRVAGWWRNVGQGTANQRLLQFFRAVVGPQIPNQLHIFVDEVDATLKLSYSDDFFTALRTMYNQRPLVPEFRRVSFCLIGVASPAELIKDRRTTPYNIGHTVELRDFDAAREDLSPLHNAVGSRESVDAILRWTGGQPLLTVALCAMAIERRALTTAGVEAMIENTLATGASDALMDQLETISNFLSTRLHSPLATLRLYSAVLRGRRVQDRLTPAHIDLRLSGLVKRDLDGNMVVRNRIYGRRFGRTWLSQTRPMRAQTRIVWVAGAFSLAAFVVASWTVRAALETAEAPAGLPPEARDSLRRAAASSDDSWNTARERACELIETMQLDRKTSETQIAATMRVRADALDALADRAVIDGRIDEALVLGAYAGTWRGALSPRIEYQYRASDLRNLHVALPGSGAPVDRIRMLAPNVVVASTADGTLRLYSLDESKEFRRGAGSKSAVALATCPTPTCLGDAANTGGSVYDAGLSLLMPFVWRTHRLGPVAALDFSHRGEVAVAGRAGDILIGQLPPPSAREAAPTLADVRLLDARTGHGSEPADVRALAFVGVGDHDDVYLAVATANALLIFNSTRPDQPVREVYFHRCGKIVAANNQQFQCEPQHREPDAGTPAAVALKLNDMRRAPAGTTAIVAVALDEGTVVYDIRRDLLVAQRSGPVATASLSHDESLVANTSIAPDASGVIVVWSVRDGKERLRIRTPRVRDAIFGEAGGRPVVVTAHDDGLSVWRIPPDESRQDDDSLDPLDDPEHVWRDWQRRFRLTVNNRGLVVPLTGDPKIGGGYGARPCRDTPP